jgi:hypothetical protein
MVNLDNKTKNEIEEFLIDCARPVSKKERFESPKTHHKISRHERLLELALEILGNKKNK